MKFQVLNIYGSLLLLLLIAACERIAEKRQIITEKIQYDVPVVSDDPRLDWWINNIEGSKREPFLKRIMEAAEKGDVMAYDYFGEPLTPEEVAAQGSDTIYLTLTRNYEPFEEYDTMLVRSITYRDISKIRFLEEWTWDPITMQIEKKVVGLGPVLLGEMDGVLYNQLLFWVYFDDRYPQK
ncbi:MAG: hypothetical protein K0B08_02925 [Bacteroidales bacterium]|nr:hypothetical protein [Bacteroidales bacterium]